MINDIIEVIKFDYNRKVYNTYDEALKAKSLDYIIECIKKCTNSIYEGGIEVNREALIKVLKDSNFKICVEVIQK